MSSNAGEKAKVDAPKASFRTVPVQQRSIWESWAVLPARTRLFVSLGITAFALGGVLVSDQLEKTIPPPEKERLAEGATKDVPPP
ncbi:hypothetical protein IEO21_01706 [Rhodonia placenta]|uniref:Uncharacterized protein n=1 Tax=Rhodonia placenta TaxID=104341 RepID=A0A8H7P9D1_9APHY|nr:hypothetical protein IEO21_01706 [Postia placenta]